MERQDEATEREPQGTERERPDTKSPPSSPPTDQQDLERGEDKLDQVITK